MVKDRPDCKDLANTLVRSQRSPPYKYTGNKNGGLSPNLGSEIPNMSSLDDNDPRLSKLAARFFGPEPPVVKIEFGALSDPGKRRKNNEDHYAVVRRRRSRDILLTNLPGNVLPQVLDESYALVVADGMGGEAFGELASMLALRIAWDLTTDAFKWPFRISEREAKELFKQIESYGQLINQAVNEVSRFNPDMEGMGTTLTGAIIVAGEVFIGHVGDSRAYLFRNGELRQLTKDHTLAQQLVDDGTIASTDFVQSYMQHVLVNCIGGTDENVRVEVHRIKLENDDRLLLCTDGLSDMVSDFEIAGIIDQNLDPQRTCQALVDRALEQGGRDNVTVVLGCLTIEAPGA